MNQTIAYKYTIIIIKPLTILHCHDIRLICWLSFFENTDTRTGNYQQSYLLVPLLHHYLVGTRTDGRRTRTRDKSSHGLWPGELKINKVGKQEVGI